MSFNGRDPESKGRLMVELVRHTSKRETPP